MTEKDLMTMIKASALDALLTNEALQDRIPGLKEEIDLLITNLFEQYRGDFEAQSLEYSVMEFIKECIYLIYIIWNSFEIYFFRNRVARFRNCIITIS